MKNVLLFLILSVLISNSYSQIKPSIEETSLKKVSTDLMDQPYASFWFPNQLLNWEPGSDLNADFNRSFTKLRDRFINTHLMVNPNARANEAKISALDVFGATSGNPSQGSLDINYFAFNYWQYIDVLVFWGGSAGEGLILAPNPGVIDAAHRNGVPVLGTVFFPPTVFGGKIEWVSDFLKKEGTTFPVADKLIEVAEYYGFDGWFINQETEGGTFKLANKMIDFLKYYQANSELEIMWYDAMTEDGTISWQETLNDNNDGFFQEADTVLSEYMFLDFGWSANDMKNARSKANELGRSEYDLHSGVDVQANGYNTGVQWSSVFPQDTNHVTSLSFYVPSWTYHSSSDVDDFYSKGNRFWVGDNRNPSNTETSSNWKGLASYVPAKSVINDLPFFTSFNTGQGYGFYLNGERISYDAIKEEGWNNLAVQDILPTWRWIVESDGEKLNPEMDWTTAWYGANSVKLSGNLNSDNLIKLFATDLEINETTLMDIAYKANTSGDTYMQVALSFKSDPSSYVYLDISEAADTNWTSETIDISSYAGNTIATISLKFDGTAATDYQMNIGQIGFYNNQISMPHAPSGLSIKNQTNENGFSTLRLEWTKSSDDISYYNVFKRNSDESRTYLGSSTSESYFVPYFDRFPGDSLVQIEVAAIGYDFGESDPSSATFIYYPLPQQVSNPSPEDSATSVLRNPTLSWKAGINSTSHDVYLGTTNPPEFIENVQEESFKAPDLKANTTYYWRIDEVNALGKTEGAIWQFETGTQFNRQTGYALEFDGENDYINFGRDASLDVAGTEITIEAWIFANSFADAVWAGTIVAKDQGSGPGRDKGYMLRLGGDGKLNINIGDGSWNEFTSAANVIELNKWIHVAGTYDGTQFKLYVDGKVVGESGIKIANISSTPSVDLQIGDSPGFPGRVFDGKIDDVRIWNKARTEKEINDYKDLPPKPKFQSNLVGYWQFDEGAGQTTFDLTTNKNHGILGSDTTENANAPVWVESEAISVYPEVALELDGADDFVKIPNDTSLYLTGTEITMEAWIYVNQFADAFWAGSIIVKDQGVNPGTNRGYMMRGGGDGQLNLNIGSGNWNEFTSPKNVITTEKWTHIAGTYDGTQFKIYVDGELVGESGIKIFSIAATTNVDLLFGESPSFPGRPFNGRIDEVRLWNIARTQDEIKSYMKRPLPKSIYESQESGLVGYWPIREGEGQTIEDISINKNVGILGATESEENEDPIWVDSDAFVTKIIEIQKNEIIPNTYTLKQNYPNPFNPSTTIEYQIPKSADVSITIYDVMGRRVNQLYNNNQSAGYYKVIWNGKDQHNRSVATGVYFYRLKAGDFQAMRKMVLIK